MRISLTAVTGQVTDLPHVAADAAATWDQHVHAFVRRAKISKPIQHEVSQSQYGQLLRETAHHPRFDGMNHEQRKAWLDERVSVA